MKTIKQIADELGIDKQRVYRYIRKHRISEAHQEAGVMHYDEAAETFITSYFAGTDRISEAHHEAHQNASSDAVVDAVIALLKSELEAKNKLIDSLQAELAAERQHSRVMAERSQQLHAGTIQHHLTDGGEVAELVTQPAGFFQRIFGKK